MVTLTVNTIKAFLTYPEDWCRGPISFTLVALSILMFEWTKDLISTKCKRPVLNKSTLIDYTVIGVRLMLQLH